MKVFIMRGIPGSGKSTWIENWVRENIKDDPWRGYSVCSADSFHIVDGVYRFDPKNAANAHHYCFQEFLNLLYNKAHVAGLDAVFVDNTNTTLWELAPYVRLCEVLYYDYEIIRVEIQPELACKRNVHEVPNETIFRMHKNLRDTVIPPHYKERIVLAEGL